MTKHEIFQRVTEVKNTRIFSKERVTHAIIIPKDNMLIPLASDIKFAVGNRNDVVQIEGCYAISLDTYDKKIDQYVAEAFNAASAEEVWAVLFC